MKKRLYSVVLLFSFFFCSGGFLVAHADSASVLDWSVNKGDNVKPDDYYSGHSFDFVQHSGVFDATYPLSQTIDFTHPAHVGYTTFKNWFYSTGNADCERIAIENPVGIMSRIYKKPSQIVQPYEYGHMEQKRTCLWLKGLPLLRPTNNVYDEMMKLPKNKRERLHYLPPSPERAKLRSKTFPGIAKAMAEQWGGAFRG